SNLNSPSDSPSEPLPPGLPAVALPIRTSCSPTLALLGRVTSPRKKNHFGPGRQSLYCVVTNRGRNYQGWGFVKVTHFAAVVNGTASFSNGRVEESFNTSGALRRRGPGSAPWPPAKQSAASPHSPAAAALFLPARGKSVSA